jgi:hypothetical protein
VIHEALFEGICSCSAPATKAGKCGRCYARWHHDQHCFDGHREQVLARDGWQCQVCQGRDLLIVHHRERIQDPERMITLCAGCHAIVHRLRFNRRFLPELLLALWVEQHPKTTIQLQLAA